MNAEQPSGPDLRGLLQSGDETKVAQTLDAWLPADVAFALRPWTETEQAAAFRLLKGPQAVHTFEYFDRATQYRILNQLPSEISARLLNDMAPDDRTALLSSLPRADSLHLLALMSEEQQAVARSLLEFPEGTVGRLMTPHFVAAREHWTIAELLDFIRNHGTDSETLNVVYVVDPAHHLVDDIRMRQVLLARPQETVATLMDRRFVALNVTDDKRRAVDLFRRYDRTALPVVDAQGVLRGIVTIDDMLDIAEQAATNEIQRLGGTEALEEPYVQTPLLSMVRKRASWLVVLFLGELLTATAMGYFEKEIERAVVLALFVPLIISSGGNSGSQAATLIVRALALGEVRIRDWWLVLRRELVSGAMLGGILGTIGFLRIAIWSGFSTIYGPHWLLVACTVGLALIGIVLWGTISGSMLPFILKSLSLDPATSSAPFVATLVDVTGLVIYFTVASLVLKGTLL